MGICVTVSNDDERECAAIGITKQHKQDDGTRFTESEVVLKGGESQRFVVQEDGRLQLLVREVHEPVLCWK